MLMSRRSRRSWTSASGRAVRKVPYSYELTQGADQEKGQKRKVGVKRS